MIYFFSFITALFVSLVMIPPLMSLSRRVGLVDVPNARKVHMVDVPLCGGIAIAIGTLLPLLMWGPLDRTIASYIVGAAVIIVLGIWDDAKPLNYRWKFAGQLIAVGCVMYGGVVFNHLPFWGLDPAPLWLTVPITVLFLLGVTNAVNLFDGLDGLAGGCIILTLSVIAILAYEVDGFVSVLIALAAMGSVCGFLRYNTHPASVFMGDAGSQFLGFTAAVLSILLIERVHPALNPALPLLLLGLPLFDTLMVMAQRIAAGRSPFKPDRTHLHHKLLSLGFRQWEAVTLIYIVQGIMVGAALALRYASDAAVIVAFFLIAAIIAIPLYTLKAVGWRLHAPPNNNGAFVERRNLWLRRWTWLPEGSTAFVRYTLCATLLLGAMIPIPIATDFSVLALGAAGFSVAMLILYQRRRPVTLRFAVYLGAAVVAYLIASWHASLPGLGNYIAFYLAILCVSLAVAIRVTRRDLFSVTPQDLLILFIAVAVPNLSGDALAQYNVGQVAIVFVVLLYGSEFLMRRDERGRWLLSMSAILSLCIVGVRPLLS
ncbi:MAG: undecaprenyl/decaprenyl-phosphate alpha-N-acetylglucosaminyl 1-phosphate transferase [Rhodospirillales bacterium]|nr:MAG: undecaprenyl/decaprenyl-phosphate alpha-N-acetylglucosaminyl 1-phosphate transferase [Rhodospirillales bacterium]